MVDSFDSWSRSLLMGLDAMDPSTVGDDKWRTPPPEIFKVNYDATIGSEEVGIELLLVIPMARPCWLWKIQPFIGLVELPEAIALYEGVSKALEASIYPLRAEIDSLIPWGLLMNSSQYSNDIQYFVDSLRALHHYGAI